MRLAMVILCEGCNTSFLSPWPSSNRRFCTEACRERSRKTGHEALLARLASLPPGRHEEIVAEAQAALAGFDHELELIEQRTRALHEEVWT